MVFAAFFLVVALAVFVLVFYLFDGVSIVSELFGVGAPTTPVPAATTPVKPAASALPDGMDEGFVLRLWQEQVDSQAAITKLTEGEIASLRTDRVVVAGDIAKIFVTARFTDQTSAPGVIVFRRIGDAWYLSYVTGMRDGTTDGSADAIGSLDGREPTSPLPKPEEIDMDLMRTVVAENRDNQDAVNEFISGSLREVAVTGTVKGPNTATINVSLTLGDGTEKASIVAVGEDVDGEKIWFLTGFSPADDDTKK